METLTAAQVRKDLYRLLEEVLETNKPIRISGKRSNAVLVSEENWNSIQETLNLTSIPGVQESIIEGLNTPLEESGETLEW